MAPGAKIIYGALVLANTSPDIHLNIVAQCFSEIAMGIKNGGFIPHLGVTIEV